MPKIAIPRSAPRAPAPRPLPISPKSSAGASAEKKFLAGEAAKLQRDIWKALEKGGSKVERKLSTPDVTPIPVTEIPDLRAAANATPERVTLTKLEIGKAAIADGLLDQFDDPESNAFLNALFLGKTAAQLVRSGVQSMMRLRAEVETQPDTRQTYRKRVWRVKYKRHGQHSAQKLWTFPDKKLRFPKRDRSKPFTNKTDGPKFPRLKPRYVKTARKKSRSEIRAERNPDVWSRKRAPRPDRKGTA